MSIKKYIADKDTTITNAFKENLVARGTNSNMGAADSLEIFSIYGQSTTSSIEKSRILIQFPVANITTDRASGKIPASGSAEFYLRLFNVKHPFSLPKDFSVLISPLSKSWEEGFGLDMEGYLDNGFISGTGGQGSTWLAAGSGSLWLNEGSDYLTDSSYVTSATFSDGTEDINVNLTNIVEQWLAGAIPNYGLLVRLSGSFEDGTLLRSFYTKKFSARSSEYYFHRPCIEARWNPAVTDDRNNFFASSSLLSADDNKMNLYFYNKINGNLKNITGNIIPTVKFYTDSGFTSEISATFNTSSNPLTGIYKVTVAIDTTASVLYDKWTYNAVTCYSGAFDVLRREGYDVPTLPEYIVNITNLKPFYAQNENVKFNIFIRERDWQPNIYSVSHLNAENSVLPNLYYKIFRINDNYTIIDYSTGSLAYTKTSYDSLGNYFDLDMNIFEKNYSYGIKLATWDGINLVEFKDVFKFRVQ